MTRSAANAGPGLREVARRTLRRVMRDEAYASLALGGEMERAALNVADRALCTEIVYGVLRHQTRIDRALAAYSNRPAKRQSPIVRTALRVAAYQMLFLDRVAIPVVVDDAVGAIRES